ncbi:MAG: tRNA (adenosine(37)-N6)-dimethylallyltransferase MiaA [Caldilineales bacterium]|nr:tRNA (adenosine(37)-N6)-dimethylallyltransferase MiaA [Caldilineales bacterium]
MLVNLLVAIVGPTAVGKTALSLSLAQTCNGEIVSADSRQVYRGMDIGTAKATPAERRLVPHHLIDIKMSDETMSLGEYQQLASVAIADIQARGGVPILVGGTGQYVQAIVEGWQIPRVSPQPELRAELEKMAEREGKEVVFARLREIDPDSAARIDYHNLRRVIRAIEVTEVSGRPFSAWQTKSPPPYPILQVGLTRPREPLYARADVRIEQMFAQGFLAEVERLLAAGYEADLPSFSSLGYREVAAHLSGEIDLDETKALIRKHTRQFIRRQYNWFSLDDASIAWFDLAEVDESLIIETVREWLASQSSG